MAVPSRSLRRAQVVLPTCSIHPGSALSHVCLSCEYKHICVKCIAGNGHDGHEVLEIKAHRKREKEKLSEAVDSFRENMKDINKIIRTAKSKQQNNESVSNVLEVAIKDRGKELKEIIDVITDNLLLQNRTNAEKNHFKLDRHIDIYSNTLENMNDMVMKSEDLILSGTTEEMIDMRKELIENQMDISLPYINNIHFNFVEDVWDEVERTFGSLDHVSIVSNRRESYRGHGYRKSFGSVSDESIDENSDVPKEVARVDAKVKVECLCPVANGETWASGFQGKEMTLITRTGNVKKSLTLSAVITGICCSDDDLFVSCDDNAVRRVLHNGTMEIVFRVSSTPLCLCGSSTKHIHVGLWDRIETRSLDGTLVNTISRDDSGHRLFSEPCAISQSSNTGNIAVASNSGLVVLDKNCQLVYRHFGSYIQTGTGDNKTKKETDFAFAMPLKPVGVDYDKNDNVVVADFRNSCLLNACGNSGKIEWILNTKRPKALAVQSDGGLWIGFGDKTVSLYK